MTIYSFVEIREEKNNRAIKMQRKNVRAAKVNAKFMEGIELVNKKRENRQSRKVARNSLRAYLK